MFYFKHLTKKLAYNLFEWRSITTQLINRSKALHSSANNSDSNADDKGLDDILEDNEFNEEFRPNWRRSVSGHNVLLVLPRQKWGPKQMPRDLAQHLLDETVALVHTLRNWTVVKTLLISTLQIRKKYLFGSGNLELIKEAIHENSSLTAIVFGIDVLTAMQKNALEEEFHIDVYDRYSIVLRIFSDHARSREAKLQIALAEIPYIRKQLSSDVVNDSNRSSFELIGGLGKTYSSIRKMLLRERESKLRKLLEKIQLNRNVLSKNRKNKEFPIIAVVGYTNCGKTSLIKALTNDQSLEPKDQLFATLDVTLHSGRLPSSMQVLYLDTVGFISYIPTTLIQSFNATLSDICDADAIVHVCDISHPNYIHQKSAVYKTLDDIQVPDRLKNSMIEVSNKVDLITDESILNSSNDLQISATKGIGLSQLVVDIEERIILNTQRLRKRLKVTNGGEDYRWLYKEAAIINCEVDPNDSNYLLCDVFITKTAFLKFQHYFSR